MAECSTCGGENPADARFCNACGSPLDAARDREVRKTVTVLFCDVVGSTALGERLDPEVLRETLSRFYETVVEAIERNGGTVQKVIGDAVVAVFGIPVVREDDALRAARAALDVADAVRAMGELEARIGVNTGDVLAGGPALRESLVVGDAINVAARIEQAAAPGEVLVGDATWALIRHAVTGTLVPPIDAKGKSAPLVAWRLESVDAAAGSLIRRLDVPMVGRDAELEMLQWSLHRTGSLGRPHLVTVLGQPGIGKSRLVSELAGSPDSALAVSGHCRSTGRSWALEPLVEAMLAAVPDGASVADLLPDDADAQAVAVCLTQQGAGVDDVAWAATRTIAALTAERTLAVVLEDMHWADEALLDVVEQLLENSRRLPLAVICTARPEFAERRPEWGAATGANRIAISLERLDDDQTAELLANADPTIMPDEATRIVAAVEGNPLFAEHMAALVGEHGSVDALPRSIQMLLTARLELLSDAERDVVGAAAAAGRDFRLEAIESLIGRGCDAEIEGLTHREVIEPAGRGSHRFTHALMHEAAYELIPKARRAELHLALGGWLGANGAADALIGDHFERAYRLRVELGVLGEATEQVREDAGARLTSAGRRADALGDPAGATMLLERALALLPESSPTHVAAMVELAAAGWNIIGTERLLELLRVATERAAVMGLRALELRAQILRMGAVPDTSPEVLTNREARIRTDEALAELVNLDDPRATATALCTRAEVAVWTGRAAEGVDNVRQAIGLLRSVDEDMVWALGILVWAVVESPMPVGEADALLAGLLADVGVRPTFRSQLLQGRALLGLLAGEADEAWARFHAAQAIDQEVGRQTAWRLVKTQVPMLLWLERFEEAAAILPEAMAKARERGSWQNVALTLSWLAMALARLGRLDAAMECASAAREAALAYEGHEPLVRSGIAFTDIHLARGDVEAALLASDESVEVASRGDWLLLQIDARRARARALRAAGREADAVTDDRVADDLAAAKGITLATLARGPA
jgi:class 3 adenylate cyclase/tetratricopeptide (TPR) repeat protein